MRNQILVITMDKALIDQDDFDVLVIDEAD